MLKVWFTAGESIFNMVLLVSIQIRLLSTHSETGEYFKAQTSHSEISQMTSTTLRRPKCSIINRFIFIFPCPLHAIAFKSMLFWNEYFSMQCTEHTNTIDRWGQTRIWPTFLFADALFLISHRPSVLLHDFLLGMTLSIEFYYESFDLLGQCIFIRQCQALYKNSYSVISSIHLTCPESYI